MKFNLLNLMLTLLVLLTMSVKASADTARVNLLALNGGICAFAQSGEEAILFDLGTGSTCSHRFEDSGKIAFTVTDGVTFTSIKSTEAFNILPLELDQIHSALKGTAYRLEFGNLSLLFLSQQTDLSNLDQTSNCHSLGLSIDESTAFHLNNPLIVASGDAVLPVCLIELVKPHIAVTETDRSTELVSLGFEPNNILSLNSPNVSGRACQIPEGVEVSLTEDGKMTVYYCTG